ncbi:MAG TPA: hypothetical protein VMW38_12780 [Terriglobia bacterium]|nr:hypothetical protein [Terriglobia bacterium]
MSERTGDKARFGRERKKRNLQRARSRELRKGLGQGSKTNMTTSAKPK